MATYRLYRWSVTNSGPWVAPEAQLHFLVGHRDQDPKRVKTSCIVETNGREITTNSGSVYILEDIDQDYLKFLDDNGLEYDPDNPIKIKKV